MGADAALDPRAENFKQKICEVVGADEVDVAFDAVGIQPTFDQVLKAVKPGGLAIAIGGWQSVSLNLGPVVAREIEIRGTFNFTVEEFEQAVRWLEQKTLDPMEIPIQTFPMGNGADVFERLSGQPGAALKVVLTL
jgi:threonine dehydrogenase-like Zn-dependent dehydrogenase